MKCGGNFSLLILLLPWVVGAAPQPQPKNYVAIAHTMLIFNTQAHRVLFVPEHPIKDVLLGLIISEKEAIIGAHYRLSDKDVIQALIDARRRHVHVELVVDQGALLEKHQKISLLQKAGVIVHVPKSPYLMHNKFFLFQRSIYSKAIIWSGSANITGQGMHKNCENVIVWENAMDYKLYRQHFEVLKKR